MRQFIGNKCRYNHIDLVLTNGCSIMCHDCHMLGDDSPFNAAHLVLYAAVSTVFGKYSTEQVQ